MIILNSSRGFRRTLALCAAALALGGLHAQEAEKLKELKRLHDQLSESKSVLTVEQGRQARQRLAEWESWTKTLKGDERTMALRVELLAALAVGDAARAVDALSKLPPPGEKDRAGLELMALVAAVNGDAPRLDETLKKLKDLVEDSEQRQLSSRQRRVRKLGTEAPDVSVKLDDGRDLALHDRGGSALFIDFWSTRVKPTPQHVQALRSLYDEYKGRRMEFLGVNTDGPAKLEDAKKFVEDHGYEWAQHYELRSAADAPITQKAFAAGPPPWCAIVDRQGRIRTVGDPSEAEFQYALRAVVEETEGNFEAVAPRPLIEKPSARGEEKSREAEPRKEKAEEKKAQTPKGELPSNPEAESKLRQARLYLKTGKRTDAKRLLQEIVKDYPGTREAREAEQILVSIP
jgi:peroxiredoxin